MVSFLEEYQARPRVAIDIETASLDAPGKIISVPVDPRAKGASLGFRRMIVPKELSPLCPFCATKHDNLYQGCPSQTKKQEKNVMRLQDLKAFSTERANIEELIEALAITKVYLATYEESKIPSPEWLSDTKKAIESDIKSRRADIREKARKELKARLEALKSREEQKDDLAKKLAELESEEV